MGLGATAMTLDPAHGKVDKLALAHKADHTVTERRCTHRAFTLKSSADFIEILAIDKERAVFLPYTSTVFHNRTVFHAVVFARVFRTSVGQVQRRILVVAHAHQQHVAVQIVQTRDGRSVAKDVAQVVAFRQELSMPAVCRHRARRMVASMRTRPHAKHLGHSPPSYW